MRLLAAIGAVAAAILFVGAAIVSNVTQPSYACDARIPPTTGDAALDGTLMRNMGQGHVAPGTRIRYATCPPTSGDHFSAQGAGPIRAGYYAPDSERDPGGWVHTLEHGYVVLLYRCDEAGCPSSDALPVLRSFVTRAPATQAARACGVRSKVVVARFDAMSTQYALLAWDRALLLGDLDAARAVAFARRWIDSPDAPEPAAC